jgi:hypothetical protein
MHEVAQKTVRDEHASGNGAGEPVSEPLRGFHLLIVAANRAAVGAVPAVHLLRHVEMIDGAATRIAFPFNRFRDMAEGGHKWPPDI